MIDEQIHCSPGNEETIFGSPGDNAPKAVFAIDCCATEAVNLSKIVGSSIPEALGG
jgi:hypothetical protein